MNEIANSATLAEDVDFRSIFRPECFETIGRVADKETAFQQLVISLAIMGRIPCNSVRPMVDALLERERTGTTAMGNGLALPNLRTRVAREFMGAVGVAPAGVDFDSLDGQPTRLIILLLSPFEERELHSELMGRLASLMYNKTLQYSLQNSWTLDSLFRALAL